jgi:purine nucleosidase
MQGAVVCDALAMAIALNPGLIQHSQTVNVEVELNGTHTRGQTVVDWGCYDGVARVKNCEWVLRVSGAEFIEMFTSLYD